MTAKTYASQMSLQLLLAGMTFMGPSDAKTSCQLVSGDVIQETAKFVQLIAEEIATDVPAQRLHEHHKIDTLNNATMAKLNGVGVITGEPLGNRRLSLNRAYGSFVVLSPCITVTAAHVIGSVLGRSDALDLKVDDEVFQGIGQTCDGNQFLKRDIRAKVAFTPAAAGDLNMTDDWAILRLSDRLPREINSVKLPLNYVTTETALIEVGSPSAQNRNQDAFKNLSAQYIKTTHILNKGIVKTTRTEKLPGQSGGAVFSASQKDEEINVEWRGLNIEGGHIIDARRILDEIQKNDPKLYREIVKQECPVTP